MSARLVTSKSQFKLDLESRIAEGHTILNSKYVTTQQFESLEKQYRLWHSFNRELLIKAFDNQNNEYLKQYEASRTQLKKLAMVRYGNDPRSLQYRQNFFTEDVAEKTEHLESLLSRVELLNCISQNAIAAADLAPVLTLFHPTVQQVASDLWAGTHYRQAVFDACIALDKAIQDKANLPANTIGVSLMTTAFSANNPLIIISQDRNEQTGFMNLYQGSVQALRNHYAHNLTEIPAPRALEWLGFISALFYKLDEVQPTPPPTAP
jgi:uncharacterized protein (TIGR02391 family)